MTLFSRGEPGFQRGVVYLGSFWFTYHSVIQQDSEANIALPAVSLLSECVPQDLNAPQQVVWATSLLIPAYMIPNGWI